jgi:beta-lactamase class A
MLVSRLLTFVSLSSLLLLPAGVSGPEELRAEIARLAVASKGLVGVAAMNLATGATIEFNADRRFKMASTFKVPVAAYAMHLGEEGRITLHEPLPIRREDMLEPGILFEHFRHPGAAISTLNAIELSVTVSDNGATEVIYQRVGGPVAANAWLKARGHGDINLGRRTLKETFSQDPLADTNAEAEGLERTATPRAMVRFLADLQRGRLLAEAHTSILLDIMSRTAGERMSLFLPPGTKVQHKTGTLFGTQGISVNDVGIMTLPGGAPVAIAVYIGDSPESVSHATRDRTIGHITRAVYDYFQLHAER